MLVAHKGDFKHIPMTRVDVDENLIEEYVTNECKFFGEFAGALYVPRSVRLTGMGFGSKLARLKSIGYRVIYHISH